MTRAGTLLGSFGKIRNFCLRKISFILKTIGCWPLAVGLICRVFAKNEREIFRN
jgi:hypothetical protein